MPTQKLPVISFIKASHGIEFSKQTGFLISTERRILKSLYESFPSFILNKTRIVRFVVTSISLTFLLWQFLFHILKKLKKRSEQARERNLTNHCTIRKFTQLCKYHPHIFWQKMEFIHSNFQ